MRFLPFANRNGKEILRDPLSLLFGIGFPVTLMILMTMLQKSMVGMPQDVFGIDAFAPGMIIFGLSFLSLFLGMLIANDRESSFLQRLFSSPLTSTDYILGYTLPIIPIAIVQSVISFIVAVGLGMEVNINILVAIVVVIPISFLFISIGLLLGTLFNAKQVGGVGSIIINAVAWLSGAWFSLEMIDGGFKRVCEILPFAYCVNALKSALSGEYRLVGMNLVYVLIYVILIYTVSAIIFKRKMHN